jgi:LacI family transcriptional regulator
MIKSTRKLLRSGRTGPTTLADIAKAARVSVSTAGRALRDDGWPVDPELKARVLRAAKKLSYVRNAMARTLRGGEPAMIGLVVGNMLDTYYGEIAETITGYAESTSRMLVVVCNMQRDPKLEMEYCQRLWEHRVGGLILAGGGFDQFSHHDELNELLCSMEKSGVVVTTLSPRNLNCPSFNVDNVQVGRLAAGALIEHGHREIAVVIGPLHNRVLKQRVQGAAACCREAGVRYHLAEAPEFGTRGVNHAVAQLLEDFPNVTGVIAASGVTSVTIAQAIAATGRKVPDDISVIGVGGAAITEFRDPQMARVDLALDVCSKAALDHIAARVSGEATAEEFVVEPRVVSGKSVGSPKRQAQQ